MPKPGSSLV